MPFLRFTRDRRGYETTALLHARRQKGRSSSRLLYWFRSPVGARIGRPAFDEEAIRLIEDHHPDIVFDWPRIMELREEPAERRGPQQRPQRRRRPQEEAPQAATEAEEPGPLTRMEADAVPEAAVPDIVPEAAVPSDEADEEPEPVRQIAAEEMFSVEDLERLRGRHAVILRRIDEQVRDAAAAEQLRNRAAALDPDTWVTADEVRQALEHYEQIYRDLREALSRRP